MTQDMVVFKGKSTSAHLHQEVKSQGRNIKSLHHFVFGATKAKILASQSKIISAILKISAKRYKSRDVFLLKPQYCNKRHINYF